MGLSIPTDACTHSRRAMRPSLSRNRPSLRTEGAGNAGCPMHPQPVCIGRKHTVVTTGSPEITRHSLRNGFNGFLRALPGDEFLLSPSSRGLMARRTRLGRPRLRKPWHQQRMPGPHDFAVRSDLAKRFDRTCATCRSFSEAVEAPFVRALTNRSQARPALRSPMRARRCRVHRIPTRVVTISSRPSFG
jgi:hypothetical protein